MIKLNTITSIIIDFDYRGKWLQEILRETRRQDMSSASRYLSGESLLSGRLANRDLPQEPVVGVQNCKNNTRHTQIHMVMHKRRGRHYKSMTWRNSCPNVHTSLPGHSLRVHVQAGEASDLLVRQGVGVRLLDPQFLRPYKDINTTFSPL